MTTPFRPMSRTLLVALGPQATSVARHTVALSHSWLGFDPPCALLCLEDAIAGSVADQSATIVELCDALADQRLIDRLRHHGWQFAHTDDLHLWLLVEVAEPAQTDDPQPSHSVVALALLQQVSDIAWSRSRLHVVGHLLFLGEPAHEAKIARAAQEMALAGVSPRFVVGPVNQDHSRLAATDWLQQAATAVTALLWNLAPSHTQLTQYAAAYCALGAAAWLSPAPLLRQCLAHYTAQWLIEQLWGASAASVADTDPPPRGSLASCIATPMTEVQELLAQTPRPVGHTQWAGRRPGWRQLPRLTADLLDATRQRSERRQIEQQQQRRSWLETRMTAWTAMLGAIRQQRLAPVVGWPAPNHFHAELTDCGNALHRVAGDIAAHLEEEGARLHRAEESVTHATQALQTLCHSFPPPTLPGLLAALTQPWSWPRWLWRYWHDLPLAGQRLLDAIANRTEIAGEEANWHLVRQINLAMSQDVRQMFNWLAGLDTLLTTLHSQFKAQGESLASSLPAPWHAGSVRTLWQEYIRQTPPADQAFWQAKPLTDWPLSPIDTIEAELLAWAAQTRWLVDWSAMDCLTAALASEQNGAASNANPENSATSAPDRLAAWLEQLLLQASPLWPGAETASETTAEAWLLTPEPVSAAHSQPNGRPAPSGWSAVAAWAKTQPDLLPGATAIDGILLLRWRLTTGIPAANEPTATSG